jgi:hypothetical protein
MNALPCPICYSPLEVRDVTLCTICGGWPTTIELFDPAEVYHEYRLPTGQTIVLCERCQLEEFMTLGGWGHRLGLGKSGLPINELQLVRQIAMPVYCKDKYCPTCDLRLAFLKVVAQLTKDGDTSS